MGLPGGLKLNVDLDNCIGAIVLKFLWFWNLFTQVLEPWEPAVVTAVSVLCLPFGLAIAWAAISDVMAIVTLHIRVLYIAFCYLQHGQVAAAAVFSHWAPKKTMRKMMF
jgi:hypothetical protein